MLLFGIIKNTCEQKLKITNLKNLFLSRYIQRHDRSYDATFSWLDPWSN